MEDTPFTSHFWGGIFWDSIMKALNNLPDKQLKCQGFIVTWYQRTNGKNHFYSEEFGIIQREKYFEYLHASTEKITHTLILGKTRSGEFSYPSTVKLNDNCVDTFGHEDPQINEAISSLWLIAVSVMNNEIGKNFTISEFWEHIRVRASEIEQAIMPDNKRLTQIANLLGE